MEDDDEFGDLYTDVLRPLTATSSSQQPPTTQTPATQSLNRPSDINTHGDDDDILYGAPNSSLNFNSSQQNQKTLISQPGWSEERTEPVSIVAKSFDSNRNLNEGVQKSGLAGSGNNWGELNSKIRFLESGDDVKVQERAFGDPNFMDDIHDVVEERDDKDDPFVEQDENLVGREENIENLMRRSDEVENLVNGSVNFDVEEVDTGIGEMGSRPMIPGLSTSGVSGVMDNQGDMKFEDDWDSDSEDDLQIVLNDNNHGHMGMDRIGGLGGGGDDEDENGEPSVIVADGDNQNHQSIEEQDWGEDVVRGADAERKELGEVAKVNGVDVAPKVGYSNHGYHPFHSQFKYVRPGAVPMPGAVPVGSGGVPGQVRPSTNVGPIAGRGRGDWRSTGMKTAPSIQKGFPGYGMPVWGNNASGRGFGSGLEFTLPSYKTIFEVDIDSFEEKPWRLMGIDISDYFNFGLNEDIWKDYCKQLEQLRLEATMQSKIRVYESGRTVQEYDPDMPPELAAAAGIHDVPSENANVGKSDAGQTDLTKGYARARPSLPTGRAIQVESGYGERLPSIDTRPPRIRDSDAIIEIVLQDSADCDFYSGNDVVEKPDNDVSRGDLRGGGEMEEEIAQENTEYFDDLPHAYDGRKRELVGRGAPFVNPALDNITEGDRNMSFRSGAPAQYYPDSKGNSPVYPGRNFGISHEERKTKGGARDKSLNMISRGSILDKQFLDNQNDSVESIDGHDSPISSSPVTVGTTRCLVVEDKVTTPDELVLADESSEREREEMALDTSTTNGAFEDEKLMHFTKKQKLISQVEQPSLQEFDDAEDSKAGRSSDNSKVRSGSSKDYWKSRDSVEEEVVQDRRSTRMGCTKRPVVGDEDNFRGRGRDERQEIERHRMSVKGRENPYPHKNWDPKLARHSHVKAVVVDKRKESDNSVGAWQWKDENPHGRRTIAEDSRKRVRSDEMGSRHRNKVRENERSDKDEHHQLKQLDNGSWRVPHDKDMGSRQRDKGVNLKSRNGNADDLRSRRREDVQLRRDHAEKEEYLHVHRDNSSRQKRERDGILDQRKRDDQARLRDEDQHSAKHKEEGYLQRERGDRQREQDEWHRLKQSQEESLSKRKREEGRGGVRSGRAAEDKLWVSHSRVKDEYKGSDREYHLKDTTRYVEQLKRRDRVENEISQHRGHADVYACGNQLINDEKRAKHERVSTRIDRADNAFDNHRVHEKKHKKNTKKGKESEGGDHNSLALFKKNQEKHNGRISETVSLKGTTQQGSDEHDIPVNHQSSRKHMEEASPDDDQQDSGRGRSKLERWISHKERDFSVSIKSSSLKVKETDTYNNSESSLASQLVDESSKKVETVDNPHPLANEKDADDSGAKNVDVKPSEDRHLDTVAKLKQRSERFKLPMPSEKEAVTIKNLESEPLPLAQNETQADLEIKPERPARKRRWTSN